MKITKIITGICTIGLGFAAGAFFVSKTKNSILKKKDEKINKFRSYYDTLNHWMELRHNEITLEQYFIKNNYKTIAIYGMGEMGNRLCSELKDSSVEIKYAIDKNAESTYSDLKIVAIEDDLEEVDAVVVSATFAFGEVEPLISEKLDCAVISLEEVVFDL